RVGVLPNGGWKLSSSLRRQGGAGAQATVGRLNSHHDVLRIHRFRCLNVKPNLERRRRVDVRDPILDVEFGYAGQIGCAAEDTVGLTLLRESQFGGARSRS